MKFNLRYLLPLLSCIVLQSTAQAVQQGTGSSQYNQNLPQPSLASSVQQGRNQVQSQEQIPDTSQEVNNIPEINEAPGSNPNPTPSSQIEITDEQLDSFPFGDSEYRLAVVGDSGIEEETKQIMYLSEFDGLLHLGDYDYRCLPDDYFTKILDANRTYQFMGVVGNHDTTEGECTEEVAQRYVDNIYNEMMSKKNKGLKCVFSPSKFMWSCVQDNIRIIGLTPDIRGADKRDEQLAFLKKYLKDATEDWKICSWHYYDKYYHTGRYQSPYNLVSGEGESFYDYCKMNGAIILSAHDHVYARTHVMSQFSKPVIDKYDGAQDGRVTQIRHGATLNILNGVGGFYIYIEQGEQMNYAHWQKKYARGKNEVNKDKFGGLFCTFNYKGNNKKAYCELLRLNSPDKVFDSFYIYRNENPESVHYSEIDTAFKEEKIKAYKIANNIVDGGMNNNTTDTTDPTFLENDTSPLQPVSSNVTVSNVQTETKDPNNKSLLTNSAFLLTGSIVASLSVIGGAVLLYNKKKAKVSDYYEDIGPLTVTVPNKSAYGYNPDNYLPPPPGPEQFGTLPVNYNNQYFDSHKYN